jgi:HlyD family secretion protein
MYPSISEMSDTALYYLPSLKKSGICIYYLIIGMVLLGLGSLFFIRVYISVQAPGVIRPAQERTAIRSMVGGLIDSLYFKEGERVEKNGVILTIRDGGLPVKQQMNRENILLQENLIHDLLLLTENRSGQRPVLAFLITGLYKEQAKHFYAQEAEQLLNLKKANRELSIYSVLAGSKVISPKEFFDVQVQQGKTQSVYQAFRRQQYSLWLGDLLNCRLKLADLRSDREEIEHRKESYCIRAPVSGTLQGISPRYPGGTLQPDETICTVSPDGRVVGECYVSTRDIGMLKPDQSVRFQIDAFNYNYFGVVHGKIVSIDNDFTMIDDKPVFKVVCRFDQEKRISDRQYPVPLKKGLTFQARFIYGRRTLWQLLYDTMNNSLNPASSRDLSL